METHLINILSDLAAGLAGGVIGIGFGTLQSAARRRHEKLEQDGKLKSGWAVMPGSGRRVAYLLLVLAAVQLVCPLLFADGARWFVSAGVVLGYGWTLWQQMRRRKAISA